MKISVAWNSWWNIYWQPKLMKIAVWAYANDHLSRVNQQSNFNTNPASDHLQHKRHKQHIPTSGKVTEASLSASWTRISRNIIQNKTKYFLLSSIFWLVEGHQVDRKKYFLRINCVTTGRRSHEAHNYRERKRRRARLMSIGSDRARLTNYRRQHSYNR